MHIYGIQKYGNNNPVYKAAKETLMYRTVFWTLWEAYKSKTEGRFSDMCLYVFECYMNQEFIPSEKLKMIIVGKSKS